MRTLNNSNCIGEIVRRQDWREDHRHKKMASLWFSMSRKMTMKVDQIKICEG